MYWNASLFYGRRNRSNNNVRWWVLITRNSSYGLTGVNAYNLTIFTYYVPIFIQNQYVSIICDRKHPNYFIELVNAHAACNLFWAGRGAIFWRPSANRISKRQHFSQYGRRRTDRSYFLYRKHICWLSGFISEKRVNCLHCLFLRSIWHGKMASHSLPG